MRPLLLRTAGLALAVGAFFPLPASALTEAEKGDIETVVRDYLIRNPEVLLEALDALEAKRAAEDVSAQKTAIQSAGSELFSSPAGTVLGNPDGDVTIVEFFDYNCGYCKRALADMENLVAADPKLRFVLKEIPVLGEDSVAASHVSLAVRHLAPNRYGEFHKALLGHKGLANADSAIGIAEDMGLDEAEVRKAMALPEVEAAIAEGTRLASLLKVTGTPSYVVGGEVVSGAIGQEGLAAKIEAARACTGADC